MSTHNMHFVNAAVAVPTIGSIFGWLPTVIGLLGAIMACIVYGLQIYDWIEKRRGVRPPE